MRELRSLVEVISNRLIAERVHIASSAYDRTLGLIGRKGLDASEAMWFPQCGAIHTWFMRFAIDVAFLDAQHRVVKLCSSVPPWRVVVAAQPSRFTVEMAQGTISRTALRTGDVLALR
jgi:uncharacterized protein